MWLLDRHPDRRTEGQTNRQTLDKVNPMCRFASLQKSQRVYPIMQTQGKCSMSGLRPLTSNIIGKTSTKQMCYNSPSYYRYLIVWCLIFWRKIAINTTSISYLFTAYIFVLHLKPLQLIFIWHLCYLLQACTYKQQYFLYWSKYTCKLTAAWISRD